MLTLQIDCHSGTQACTQVSGCDQFSSMLHPLLRLTNSGEISRSITSGMLAIASAWLQLFAEIFSQLLIRIEEQPPTLSVGFRGSSESCFLFDAVHTNSK
jgi:hypothetical protein